MMPRSLCASPGDVHMNVIANNNKKMMRAFIFPPSDFLPQKAFSTLSALSCYVLGAFNPARTSRIQYTGTTPPGCQGEKDAPDAMLPIRSRQIGEIAHDFSTSATSCGVG